MPLPPPKPACPICNGTGWRTSNITNTECRKEGVKVTCRDRCPNGCMPPKIAAIYHGDIDGDLEGY